MDVDYMLACGIIWRKTADPVAGWELIEGLESQDPHVRQIAQTILVECGEPSLSLLESAIATGTVTLDSAGACMAEILLARTQQQWTSRDCAMN